jgi:hypothetical protein
LRLPSAAFSILLTFAVIASVLAGHFWLIQTASSPVPVHDQWQAAAISSEAPLWWPVTSLLETRCVQETETFPFDP